MRTILILILRYYQSHYSKYTPHCRYLPSCSQYMIDAIRLHGAVKGVFLGFLRLLRCNAHGGCGNDPVPEYNAVMVSLRKTFGGRDSACRINMILLVATSLLYLFNRLTLNASSPYFMRCHFNDLCCGCWFMSVTNLILWPSKKRISKLNHIFVYLGLWGVYWEAIGPLFKQTAVFDVYDIVAYLAGGLTYWIAISMRRFAVLRVYH